MCNKCLTKETLSFNIFIHMCLSLQKKCLILFFFTFFKENWAQTLELTVLIKKKLKILQYLLSIMNFNPHMKIRYFYTKYLPLGEIQSKLNFLIKDKKKYWVIFRLLLLHWWKLCSINYIKIFFSELKKISLNVHVNDASWILEFYMNCLCI